MPFICHSDANRMSFVCHSNVTRIYSYAIRKSRVCSRMCSYIICMYSYAIRMSLVCTRMLSVCHSYVLVCQPYFTRIYWYVIRMSLVCARMSSACHSYVWFYHEPKLTTTYYSKIIFPDLLGFMAKPQTSDIRVTYG